MPNMSEMQRVELILVRNINRRDQRAMTSALGHSVNCDVSARNLVHVGFVVDKIAAAGDSPSTEHLH